MFLYMERAAGRDGKRGMVIYIVATANKISETKNKTRKTKK
jgi:hypothetical protein